MKRVITGFFLMLCAGFISPALAQEGPSPEMENDIRQLMNAMGMGDLSNQILGQMIGQMKQMAPDAPEAFWTNFQKKADGNELIELIIPIYAKHFSHAEIKELIGFYNSPIGKKVTATLPAITQESMVAGQQWGMKLAQDVMAELKAQGHQ